MTKPKLSAEALAFVSAPDAPKGHVHNRKDDTNRETPKEAPEKPQDPRDVVLPLADPAPPESAIAARRRKLEEEMAELERQEMLDRIKGAKFPWENPELVKDQQRVGYNFKIDPELYLKIQWLMENKGGYRSIQVFLDKAAVAFADQLINELKVTK